MPVLPDTSIPLQAGRATTQLDIPELMRLRVQQGLAAQQEQLLALEREKQQRAFASEDQLRQAVSQGGDIYGNLINAGRLPEAAAYQKSQSDLHTNQLDQQTKLGSIIKQAAGSVLAAPTEQNAIAVLNQLEQLTGHSMDKDKALIYGFRGDPTSITKWAAGYADPDKLFPKIETKDAGGSLITQSLDPLTGAVTPLSSQEKTLSPADVERNRLTDEGHQIQIRGQNIQAANQRLMRDIQERQLSTGKLPPGYRLKADGSGDYEAIPGGPADQKLNTAKTGKESVKSMTDTLKDYYEQLKVSGGITSTDENAIRNIGSQAATSTIGQIIGRSLGTQNQSIRDSISQTRPLLLQAIKNATGMSAKQMDSNAELKIWLSAATDPSQGYQANIRALEKLNELYGIGVGTGEMKASAAPKIPASSVINDFRSQFGY